MRRGLSPKSATTCPETEPARTSATHLASLWQNGIANAGADSDALVGKLRERNAAGVHFSGRGLREHGAGLAVKVLPWLDQQWAEPLNTHGVKRYYCLLRLLMIESI